MSEISYAEGDAPLSWRIPLHHAQIAVDYRGVRIVQGDRVEAFWLRGSFEGVIVGACPPRASDYGITQLVIRRESDGRLIVRDSDAVVKIDPPSEETTE